MNQFPPGTLLSLIVKDITGKSILRRQLQEMITPGVDIYIAPICLITELEKS